MYALGIDSTPDQVSDGTNAVMSGVQLGTFYFARALGPFLSCKAIFFIVAFRLLVRDYIFLCCLG